MMHSLLEDRFNSLLPFVSAMLLAGATVGAAQSDTAFDVASIRPSRVIADGTTYGRVYREPGRISYEYVSLQNLLAQAFLIKNSQISGPAWLDAEHFDIVATFPESTTADQIAKMLQTLLRNRFDLSFHRQPKETNAYGLLVIKGGPKAILLGDEVVDGRTQFAGSVRRLTGKITMEYLAGMLSNLVDRPVVDLTQLKGVYDVKLTWADDNAVKPSEQSESVPALFTAIQQQLGLRLDARRTSVDMFVIDRLDRAPTAN